MRAAILTLTGSFNVALWIVVAFLLFVAREERFRLYDRLASGTNFRE